jgi:NAD-dependent SIR2 family protein deacetylase
VSDRKYRQRGYQDSDRERRPAQTGPKPQAKPPGDGRIETRADKAERKALEGRTPSMPGFHEVMRCSRCGNVFTSEITPESRCRRCGADLRTCAQCESFDTGKRFECAQPIAARISPKDARNSCELFSPRVTIERETHSEAQPQAPSSARKAFDDLFK